MSCFSNASWGLVGRMPVVDEAAAEDTSTTERKEAQASDQLAASSSELDDDDDDPDQGSKMSQKRSYSAMSPTRTTPGGTPAASVSPVASTSNLALGPAPKRRRGIGRPRKSQSGISVTGHARGESTADAAAGAAPARKDEEEEEDEDEEEEEVRRGKFADDDYSVRKKEDQANKEKLKRVPACSVAPQARR